MDQAIYDDGNEDGAWTEYGMSRRTLTRSGGPLNSGCRSRRCGTQGARAHLGIMIDRDVYRYNEPNLALLRQSKPASYRSSGR